MKKIIFMLQSLIFCAVLVFTGLAVEAKEVGPTNLASTQSSSSEVYTNEFYTLSYENNKIKLLLNSELSVYQNLTKEDLVEFKNGLFTIVYKAIFDDVNLNDLTSNIKTSHQSSTFKLGSYKPLMETSSTALIGGVDISTIQGIITGQLVDVDTIADAISGDKYDTLIEYYVDNYVDAYVSANQNTTVNETLVEVQEKLTTAIQEVVVEVYSDIDGEDLSDIAPIADVATKIETLVTNVQTVKDNNESITIDLTDVKDIINIVSDSQTIIDVINEIQVKDEISDIIVNSTPEQAVDFITSVEMSTIIDVYKEVEIKKEDVSDIINNMGVDNLIDVIDKVGMDNIKDLVGEMGFTSDDFKEIINNNVSNISIGTFVKSVKTISIDGNHIFANGNIVGSGFKSIIKNLPNFTEIANYTDEQMNLSWNLCVETVFGNVEFDLTVGFKGDCSYIRTIAKELADVIDVRVEDGVFYIDVIAPERLSNILLRLTNTSVISDDIKHALFSNLFGTVDNLYQNITDKTLEEYLEYLKEVDYKVIVANLYNAENLNKLFQTNKFTDARLDAFVDEVCKLIPYASNITYDRIKAFVGKYIDISRLDNTAVETLITKVHNLLVKIDAKSLDSKLLREFIDPNSQYTNENVYNYIDKLANYENYFNKAMSIIEKLYNKIPDRFKDNTILDLYDGNGKFSYTGRIPLEYERVLKGISSKYGEKVYSALSFILDKLPSEVNVSVTFSMKDVYSVTYNYGEETVSGMLPVGADVHFFANTNEVNGYKVITWVDANGVEYKTMPDFDVELYAVTGFDAVIENGVNKVYDAKTETLTVTTTTSDSVTYQWYKDGVAIPNANSATFDVLTVADSGSYYCEVSSDFYTTCSNTVEIVIEKATIDMTDVVWDYTTPFTYDGTEKTVALVNVPEGVEVEYTGNVGTNVDEYTAAATFTYDNVNYVLSKSDYELKWQIVQATIDMTNVAWDYTTPFTYDGTEKTVALVNVPEGVTVEYTGNVGTSVAEYTATATFTYDNVNYVLSKSDYELTWEIVQATIDMTDVAWDYTTPFTYDGTEKTVALTGLPQGVTVEYTGNVGTNVAEYTATATFTYDNVNYKLSKADYELKWQIVQATIDMTNVAWDYTTPFTYDGTEKTVALTGLPQGVTVEYTGNVGTNVAEYTATATFTYDNVNYKLSKADFSLTWKINKAKINVSGAEWNYTTPFVYDGTEKTVTLKESTIPAGVTVVYLNNSKTNVGNYTAVANVSLVDADNYELEGTISTLDWAIVNGDDPIIDKEPNKQVVDADGNVLVDIQASNGIPKDHNVKYDELDASTLNPDLSSILGENQTADLLAAFDIGFTDANGNPVTLTDNFTVRLLIPSVFRALENLKVVHIADDGTITDMDATRDGDYMIFETDHFSVYAIIQVKDDAPQNDLSWLIWVIVVLLIIIAILVVLLIRKNNKHEETPTEEVQADETLSVEPTLEEAPLEEEVLEEPTEEPVEEEVVEEPIEEEVVEEPIEEEVVEEPTEEPVEEEVVEEPTEEILEEAAPVEEPAPVETNTEAIIEARVQKAKKRLRFKDRLVLASDKAKNYYNEIKNYLVMYRAKGRYCARCETFRYKGLIAKVGLAGKSIKVYLALEPQSLEGTKYHYRDVQHKKQYAQVPTMIKVKSDRGLKYFKELVDQMMALRGVKPKRNFVFMDYISDLELSEEAIEILKRAEEAPIDEVEEIIETPVVPAEELSAEELDEQVDDDDDDDDDNDNDDNDESNVTVEKIQAASKSVRRKFNTRMMLAPDEAKSYYSEVKNYLLSYRTKSRMSSKCENFRYKGLVAKLGLAGKSVKVYLALDPNNEEIVLPKYHCKDASAKRQYTQVPTMIKVRSPRSLKYFKELVDKMMKLREVKPKRKYVPVDFVPSLIPNGEAILSELGYGNDYIYDTIHVKNIPADLPDTLLETLPEIKGEPIEGEVVTASIYLDTLCNHFEDGEVVTMEKLKSLHLVTRGNALKVKARGTLDRKLVVYADEFDAESVKMILCTNGTVVKVVR